MKVYLAGNMVTNWRDSVPCVEGVEWVHPARGDDWYERQCEQMDESDAILANIDMEARHIGTIAELSAFRAMGKPRVLVLHPDRKTDRGYVIAVKLASTVAKDLDEAVQIIEGWRGRDGRA
jgi:nucleoside 2-deoxyribosyltransferase